MSVAAGRIRALLDQENVLRGPMEPAVTADGGSGGSGAVIRAVCTPWQAPMPADGPQEAIISVSELAPGGTYGFAIRAAATPALLESLTPATADFAVTEPGTYAVPLNLVGLDLLQEFGLYVAGHVGLWHFVSGGSMKYAAFLSPADRLR